MVNPHEDHNVSLMTKFNYKKIIRMVMCHYVWLLWLKHVICVKSYVVLWLKCATFSIVYGIMYIIFYLFNWKSYNENLKF
jgi:hypothetical protein